MATFVLRDVSVTANAVDLSSRVQSVEVTTSREDVDLTAMGAVGKARKPGIKDESITINWRQDFALTKVDATLWPIYSGGTSVTIDIKPTSSAASTSNPRLTGSVYLLEYQPIAGEVGAAADASSTFVVDGVITRATT